MRMTMKERLDRIVEEQANGVTLTAEEATARKAAIVMDAQSIVMSHFWVAKLLQKAIASLSEYIKTEQKASSICLEIIDQMQRTDVSAE